MTKMYEQEKEPIKEEISEVNKEILEYLKKQRIYAENFERPVVFYFGEPRTDIPGYTTDIAHARNFEKDGNRYYEKKRSAPPDPFTIPKLIPTSRVKKEKKKISYDDVKTLLAQLLTVAVSLTVTACVLAIGVKFVMWVLS